MPIIEGNLTTIPTMAGSGGTKVYLSESTNKYNVEVYISPSNPTSREPSLILIKSSTKPTVKVILVVNVELKGIIHNIVENVSEEYTMEGIPLPWSPSWYLVPVPGLPAVNTDRVSIHSHVEYYIYVGGSKVYSGSYDISERQYEVNLPPFVYAFVEDALRNKEAVNETLGLSPRGWSVSEGKPEIIFVLAIDDKGFSSIKGEYRIVGEEWRPLNLENSTLLDAVAGALQRLKENLLEIAPGLGQYAPKLPIKLLKGTIPGELAGTAIEFRAYATDVNGTTGYSLHGLYYVDKGKGKRIMVIDPWVPVWTVSRVIRDYRPTVAVDLAHGESNKGLNALTGNITFVKWKTITSTITSDELMGVDILIIGQPVEAFSDDEVNAIRSWLSSGHKVLWIGGDSDYGNNGPIIQGNCNSLLEALGSRLRLETGDIIDSQHNIGGKSYRVLVRVDPDISPLMLTQLLRSGIEKPVLFHGPAAVIWLDSNGRPHDPVTDTYPGLIRIVYTYNSASIIDNNPPPPMLYDPHTSKNRNFTLMAADKLDSGSIVVVSGETPYGGFEPISASQYMGVELDGMQFIEDVILWASLNSMKGKFIKDLSSYNLPPGRYKGVGLPAVEFSMLGLAKFHYWQSIASNSDIYIVAPSKSVFKLLNPNSSEYFNPVVIILSNLGLGLNLTTGLPSNIMDWDLRDITSSEGSLLSVIINYTKSQHAGLVVTHATLSDLMVWYSCESKVKIGSRGHVGYSLEDVGIDNESTIAAALGMPQLALWEAIRDKVAYELCQKGEETGYTLAGMALYTTGLALGSTPLQVPYVPWKGDLHITREGEALGWNLPSDFNITIPSIYNKYGYNAYTEVGWQLAMPRAIMYSLSERIRARGNETSIIYSYISAISRSQRLIGRQVGYEIKNETLKAIYNIISNSTFKDNSFITSIDIGRFNKSLKNYKYNLNISVSHIVNSLLKLMPVRLLAVSRNGEAAIITFDKYWINNGYRSVYFSFEVEASPNKISYKLINEAIRWVSEWEHRDLLAYIGNKLPVDPETKGAYEKIIGSTPGSVIVNREIVIPDGGKVELTLSLDPGKTYVLVVVHPTTEKVNISTINSKIIKINSINKVTYAYIKSSASRITIHITTDPDLSLNPALITVKTYQTAQATTTIPPKTTPTTPPATTREKTKTTQSSTEGPAIHPTTPTTYKHSRTTSTITNRSQNTAQAEKAAISPYLLLTATLMVFIVVIALVFFKRRFK